MLLSLYVMGMVALVGGAVAWPRARWLLLALAALGVMIPGVLFAVVMWRAFRIALLSKDPFGTYVAAGIASMFAIQMFVNIGMTLGIMPITGIPLPFVSYGGSSLVANYAAVGLLLNVHMRRFK